MSHYTPKGITPLPWRAFDRGIGFEVVRADDENDNPINSEFRDTFSKADANYLVHAANEYPKAIDALRDALEELRLIRMKDTDAVYDPTLRIRIESVLERAKEREESDGR